MHQLHSCTNKTCCEDGNIFADTQVCRAFLLTMGAWLTYKFTLDMVMISRLGLQRYTYYKFTALETKRFGEIPTTHGIASFGVYRRQYPYIWTQPPPAHRTMIQVDPFFRASCTHAVQCSSESEFRNVHTRTRLHAGITTNAQTYPIVQNSAPVCGGASLQTLAQTESAISTKKLLSVCWMDLSVRKRMYP